MSDIQAPGPTRLHFRLAIRKARRVGNRVDVASVQPVGLVNRTLFVQVPQQGRRAGPTGILTGCPMGLDWAAALMVVQGVRGGVAAGMSGALGLFGAPAAGEAPAVPQDVGGVPVRTTRVPMWVQTRVRTSVQTGLRCAVQVVGPVVGRGAVVARAAGRLKGPAQAPEQYLSIRRPDNGRILEPIWSPMFDRTLRGAISQWALGRRLAKPPRGLQSGERLHRLAVKRRVHSLRRSGLPGRPGGVGAADVMVAVGVDRAVRGDRQATAIYRALRAEPSAMAGPEGLSVKHDRHGRRGHRVRQDRYARTAR